MSNELLHHTRCDICRTDSDADLGAACAEESCKYGSVIRVIELGTRNVEIASKGPTGFQTVGIVGTALSREFGVRDYKTFAGAERAALKWLQK